MSEVQRLEREVMALRKTIRRLSAVMILGACGLLAAALAPQESVIRARGLVIMDAAGRERIVLGDPMSDVTNDAKLADAIGIVVLDSLGQMNVALGVQNPLVVAGGQTAQRAVTGAGLTIYDPRDGKERGGISAFEDGRANVCLDYGEKQKEAACLSVAPADQYAAVLLNGTPGEPQHDRVAMFVGADGQGAIKVFGGYGNSGGVLLTAGASMPKIQVFDTTGAPVSELVSPDRGSGSPR